MFGNMCYRRLTSERDIPGQGEFVFFVQCYERLLHEHLHILLGNGVLKCHCFFLVATTMTFGYLSDAANRPKSEDGVLGG